MHFSSIMKHNLKSNIFADLKQRRRHIKYVSPNFRMIRIKLLKIICIVSKFYISEIVLKYTRLGIQKFKVT